MTPEAKRFSECRKLVKSVIKSNIEDTADDLAMKIAVAVETLVSKIEDDCDAKIARRDERIAVLEDERWQWVRDAGQSGDLARIKRDLADLAKEHCDQDDLVIHYREEG